MWRSCSAGGDVVELCTCGGEVVEVLRSSDPAFAEYVLARPTSERAPDTARRPRTTPDVDELGKGSFPASDPPAAWTWEVPRRP